MDVFDEIRVNILKNKLEEKDVEYIEDNLRILISLDKLDTVEEIVDNLNTKVLDEVINYEELGGDNQHYYLVAKSDDIPILEYQNIKNREAIDIFRNTVFLEYGYDIMNAEDGSGFASERYVKKCLQSPNAEFRDEVDCFEQYTEVKLTNMILL